MWTPVLLVYSVTVTLYLLLFLKKQSNLRARSESQSQQSLLLEESIKSVEAANQRIEAAATRFEELFQGLPIACFGYDEHGTIFEWNRACEHMFGLTAGDLFMRTVYDLLGSSEQEAELHDIVRRVYKGQAVERIEWEYRGYSGSVRYLLCSTFPIQGPYTSVRGGIFSCVDLTAQKLYEQQIEEHRDELQNANERLAEVARRDSLTGLLNHSTLIHVLDTGVKNALSEGTQLSFVLLDLDYFKRFNDEHGHSAGDEMLKGVASLIRSVAGERYLAGRCGGEEFGVVLPGMGAAEAESIAEELRRRISEAEVGGRRATASIGVATLVGYSGSGSKLYERADEALYVSKKDGRNRVTHHRALSDLETS